MEGYDDSTYGDRIAPIYDDLYGTAFDTRGAVAFLAGLASGGTALELGIGTGRVALPLAEAGAEVHGLDMSEAMLERLRGKPGGDVVHTHTGNFADFSLGRTFDVVYVVFNTLFSLRTQDDQVRCLERVAAHLDERGVFVVEAFVPDPARFDRGQRVEVEDVQMDEVHLTVSRHDNAAQRFTANHLRLGPRGVEMFPVSGRYIYPSELDLMARLAGLRLRERWEDWHRKPFSSDSGAHVSVYDKLPA